MSRQTQFALYVVLSLLDFAATVFLVTHGYADEANPIINHFVTLFSAFWMGLAIYKLLFLSGVVVLLRSVHRLSPAASARLLVFANITMLCLGAWHIFAIKVSLGL